MPKHNFMISKAVDLVARKLAGMDAETVARLTQILSEEAQMISDELQQGGENVSSDILAARLEGVVARMKYEARNQGPDPSPYEFPIFNVSHNPMAPYPNPINHLYDNRYKEAYSTFIKQNQSSSSTPQKNEPSTPTSPSSSQQTIDPNSPAYAAYRQAQFQQQQNKQPSTPTSSSSSQQTIDPNSPAYAAYRQGQFQQQPNKQPSTPASPSSSQQTIDPNSPAYAAYRQAQFQQQPNKQPPYPTGSTPGYPQQQANKQPPYPTGSTPGFPQQPTGGWQYINPYATMPRSHAAYYQQQAPKIAQPIQEQPSTNNAQPVRRSSTGDDIRSHSLSRSASSNELNYPTNSGGEKIRVRVINDNSASSSTDPQTNTFSNHRPYAQRSILNSNTDNNDNNEIVPIRTIYTAANTEIGTETMRDLFKVVNQQGSAPSQTTERVVIIDRRGSNTPDNNSSSSGMDRFRTFEIRPSAAGATPSTPTTPPKTSTATTPSTPTQTNSTPSTRFAMQQPNYFPGQQFFYQQPKMYSSVPRNLQMATPYGAGVNNFYPFGYFYYK